ncbi:uncharacterized protein LOC18422449 [Amborella trichopoda]|nr:uncharacterized protein LOC18422449 [Amborella trichopoda]|eukprot:XP_006826925.2 uncharacterized protein LOC18422449 [Amborella trichopoda]
MGNFVIALFASLLLIFTVCNAGSLAPNSTIHGRKMSANESKETGIDATEVAQKKKPKLLEETLPKEMKKPSNSSSVLKSQQKKLNSSSNESDLAHLSPPKKAPLLPKPNSPKNKTTQLTTKKKDSGDRKPPPTKNPAAQKLKTPEPKKPSLEQKQIPAKEVQESKKPSPEKKQIPAKEVQESKKPSPENKQIPAKEAQESKKQAPKTQVEDDYNDLIQDFREFPARFQSTVLPELEKLSSKSKAYINKANENIAEGFKPLIGHHYAPIVATTLFCVLSLLPLLLAYALYRKLRPYLTLQHVLLFSHVYLALYFLALAMARLSTGVEPLGFFYGSGRSSYVATQVVQGVGYVVYVALLLVHLFVGAGAKRVAALGQAMVGLAVGVHYYAVVWRWAMVRKAPRSDWWVHVVYAAGFVLACVCARVHLRVGKKGYGPAEDQDKQN